MKEKIRKLKKKRRCIKNRKNTLKRISIYSPSQSAPTILVYQVGLKFFLGSGTLKKGPKYGLKKAGCKKPGHYYSKREEAAWPLLCLNNNELVFLHPTFCNPYFGPLFYRVTNRHRYVFKTRLVGTD